MSFIFNNLFGKKEQESPLDEKKKENENGGNPKLDWRQFTIKFFTHFLVTICVGTVILGACGLYTTKVAYSGILPDDITMAPYTEADYKMGLGGDGNEESIEKSFVIMNVLKERLWKGLNFFKGPINVTAQQATFIKEDFKDNGLFNWLNCIQYHKEDEFGSRWSFYMRKIFFECIASSFYIVSKMFSFLYMLPEWLVLLAYFTILPFICCAVFVWTGVKGIWNILTNLMIANRFYNEDSDNIDDNMDFKWWRKMVPEDEDFLKEYGWYSRWFIWLCWKMSFILLPMLYVFSAVYCLVPMTFMATLIGLINPLLRKYKLKGENPNVEHGLGDFIRDTFFYKKTFIIFLAAYNLLMSTGLYLNSSYTASCFIGILILALYFEMFQTKMPEDPTQLDGFENIGKYFNFKKNENGEFKCSDGKKVLPRWQANLKKKMVDETGTGTGTGNETKYTKPYARQQAFSNNHYLEPKDKRYSGDKRYENPKYDIDPTKGITPTKPENTSGTEPVDQGMKLEETMNPLQQQPNSEQQQGGSKPKTKVITKTGKIRQRYNVSLI
jgi:hypothetical protein